MVWPDTVSLCRLKINITPHLILRDLKYVHFEESSRVGNKITSNDQIISTEKGKVTLTM